VGDYLCERFGDLRSNPLTIEVENNRIRALHSENKDLRDEFRAYTNTDENSNRVGEFAIGTNTACTHIIGHIVQDEKIAGVHIAFGHPYAEHTGAYWTSKTHIDCVGRDFDIWLTAPPAMTEGKFLIYYCRERRDQKTFAPCTVRSIRTPKIPRSRIFTSD